MLPKLSPFACFTAGRNILDQPIYILQFLRNDEEINRGKLYWQYVEGYLLYLSFALVEKFQKINQFLKTFVKCFYEDLHLFFIFPFITPCREFLLDRRVFDNLP